MRSIRSILFSAAVAAALLLDGCCCTATGVHHPPDRADVAGPVGAAEEAELSGEATEAAEAIEAVFGPTLELFWRLAAVQLDEPAAAELLLEAAPLEPAPYLEPLDVGFPAYREELARAGVRPVVLSVPSGADPVAAAEAQGLALREDRFPPALLTGPEVDTLILFYPLGDASLESAGARPGPRLAALDLGFARAAMQAPAGASCSWRYRVRPRDWTGGTVYEHLRCGEPTAGYLDTRLVYGGGSVDRRVTRVRRSDWSRCALSADCRGVARPQRGRTRARRPVVIAASYVLDPHPGPLLADWIRVR